MPSFPHFHGLAMPDGAQQGIGHPIPAAQRVKNFRLVILARRQDDDMRLRSRRRMIYPFR